MHSFDTALATAAALALGMLALTTAFHHQALRLLARAVNGSRVTQQWVVAVLAALVGVHLAEVALYGGGNAVRVNMFALGGLRGSSGNAALDFFYFAAETYSTLGYGDLVPVGALRLVACVEALNGLMLLAWSGAFLFGVLDSDARNLAKQQADSGEFRRRNARRGRRTYGARRFDRWKLRGPGSGRAYSRLANERGT
jgi:Ion channel